MRIILEERIKKGRKRTERGSQVGKGVAVSVYRASNFREIAVGGEQEPRG